jgi:hypothetical protein
LRRDAPILAHSECRCAKSHVGRRFFGDFTGETAVLTDEALNNGAPTDALLLGGGGIENSRLLLGLRRRGQGQEECEDEDAHAGIFDRARAVRKAPCKKSRRPATIPA